MTTESPETLSLTVALSSPDIESTGLESADIEENKKRRKGKVPCFYAFAALFDAYSSRAEYFQLLKESTATRKKPISLFSSQGFNLV